MSFPLLTRGSGLQMLLLMTSCCRNIRVDLSAPFFFLSAFLVSSFNIKNVFFIEPRELEGRLKELNFMHNSTVFCDHGRP